MFLEEHIYVFFLPVIGQGATVIRFKMSDAFNTRRRDGRRITGPSSGGFRSPVDTVYTMDRIKVMINTVLKYKLNLST